MTGLLIMPRSMKSILVKSISIELRLFTITRMYLLHCASKSCRLSASALIVLGSFWLRCTINDLAFIIMALKLIEILFCPFFVENAISQTAEL